MSPVWKYEAITWDPWETSDRHECLHETCRKFLFFFCGLFHCAFLTLTVALLIRKNTAFKKREKKRVLFLWHCLTRFDKTSFKVKASTFDASVFYLWCFQCFNQILNHRILKNLTGLIFFGIFPVTIISEWSNNTLAHAQNNDLRPISNQFVFT